MKLWLEADSSIDDDEVILFLDPDMVFLERIDIDLKKGQVVGQRWLSPDIERDPNWERYGSSTKGPITPSNLIVYPFCATAGDMRRIVDRFIEISQRIHDEDGCWGADMYALVITMLEDGLELETLDDLGVCNHWPASQNAHAKMVHYPWPIFDRDGRLIWFKQAYTPSTLTRPWSRPPLPGRATTAVEARLLEVLHAQIDRQSEGIEREHAAEFHARIKAQT